MEKVTADDDVGRIVHEQILDKYCPDYYLVGRESTCLGSEYPKFAERIKNFQVRNDDTWVCSYPKAGTTWTQEMVWLIANNLNYEGAETGIGLRCPFFEASTISNIEEFNKIMQSDYLARLQDSIKLVDEMKSPRFIKTHLSYCLLPDEIQNGTKTPKMIYVMRNPKDVCVSYLHHGNAFQGWRVKLEDFCKVFMDDKAMFGSYWKHVLGYWEQRSSPNLLIIKYEDMKADLAAVVRKVARFLGKEVTDEQMPRLLQRLSFETMKNKDSKNTGYVETLKKNNLMYEETDFFRSGTVGKYKDELSAETVKTFDAWIKHNIAGTSFEKEYDYGI